MPPPPNKKRQSIEKMLQSKAIPVVKEDIIIPKILDKHNDIRAHPPFDGEAHVPMYNCSTFARDWFREHSNFEDVLSDYVASSKSRKSREYLATKMIRMLTTLPLKQLEHPMNSFRFNSGHDEAIAKMLLMHPEIEEEEDLREVLQFHNKNRLQLCAVSLSLDNFSHADGLKFVTEKQRSQKTEALPLYTEEELFYYIHRQHYKREGLTEDVYLVDLTVAELEKISNFKKTVTRMMEKTNREEKTDYRYKAYSEAVLDLFKTDTELLLMQKIFTVKDPKINLICNVMTIDQQAEAATDMESFYSCTNAKKECRKLRDGTTREQFFGLYCSRDDHEKKLVPFHRLFYKESAEAAAKVTEVKFQSRVRFETVQRSTPPIESIDVSSEASNETVPPAGPSSAAAMRKVAAKVVQEPPRVSQPKKPSSEPAGISTKTLQDQIKVELTLPSTFNSIPPMIQLPQAPPVKVEQELPRVPAPQLSLPQLFLEMTAPNEEVFQLATIMCPNNRFVSDVKRELRATYKLNFEQLWKEKKKTILVAYIKKMWEEDLEKLIQLTENWPTEIEAREIKSILMRREPQHSEDTESSFASATSDQAQPGQQQSSNNDVELEAGEVPLPGLIPVIKQEPQALEMNYTDVECLGTLVEHEIVIDDSQDFEDSLVQELQEENETANPFLSEINGGPSVIIPTQVSEESNPNNYSDETLRKLQDFVPMSVHQKIADKKAKAQQALKENKPATSTSTSGETKRKQIPPCKPGSVKKSRPGNLLLYLDDDEETFAIDGSEPPACQLQQTMTDDFSVFLRPEIINDGGVDLDDDCVVDDNQLNPFTYTRTTSGESEAPNDTPCFIVHLNRAIFEKNVKFDLVVNIPQHSLYNLVISGDSVRDLLNISDAEFESILNLLNLVNTYEFNASNSRPSKLGRTSTARQLIIQQLDFFFSSQIKFKSFSLDLNSDDGRISCHGGNQNNYNMDLTSALDQETLKALRRCKNANQLFE